MVRAITLLLLISLHSLTYADNTVTVQTKGSGSSNKQQNKMLQKKRFKKSKLNNGDNFFNRRFGLNGHWNYWNFCSVSS